MQWLSSLLNVYNFLIEKYIINYFFIYITLYFISTTHSIFYILCEKLPA